MNVFVFTNDERGTGVVGTAFGAAVFMAFLLLATHTLLSLYATSVVTSTAWDAARSVAGSGASDAAVVAEVHARERLSGFDNTSVDIQRNATDVSVHVQVDRPMFLPTALARRSGLGRIDKTVHTRAETWQ
jgi:hypothetical protein